MDHRQFWDAMDVVDAAALVEIERRPAVRMVGEFGLGVGGLALDMTNFATFIDSANGKAPIAARGHAKQKRSDLRLVGLGMVVSRDGGVPLVGHAYAGNRPDVAVFGAVIEELVVRYRRLAAADQALTVVFDAGQNSAANLRPPRRGRAALRRLTAPQRLPTVVGHPGPPPQRRRRALPGTDRPRRPGGRARRPTAGSADPLTEPARQTGRRAGPDHRQSRPRVGRDRRGPTTRQGTPRPRRRALRDRPHPAAPLAGPDRANHPHRDTPAELRLTWTIDPAARRRLETELFGKRILVTDHDDWPVTDLIAAYRSQNDAERGFRQLKDPKLVSFSPLWHWTDQKIRVHVSSPLWHWTDQKIRVHVSYCVTALALAHLMRRQATHAGLPMSVRELLAHLASIQETMLLYPSTGGRPRARRMLTQMTPTQQQLYDLFGLDRYAPTPRPAQVLHPPPPNTTPDQRKHQSRSR